MKRLILFLTGLIGLTLNHTLAGDMPRGSLMELHSCEVYAGGCVVSSEATQGGRYMLRVWDFTGGSFNGTDLKGSQLAVLQLSPDNLAAPDSKSGDAVVYLPQASTPGQRDALVAWLKSSQPDFHPASTQTRVVPLQFAKTDHGYSFSAGNFICVNTAPFQRCEMFTCGEALWYQPRTATSLFTVAVDRASQVSEPLLALKWNDAGKRSVFLARFGQPDSAKGLYVSLDEVCGSVETVF
jgi:hypothetical protein